MNGGRKVKALRRIAAGLALTLTATALGGIWYGRYYLTTKLVPLLEQNLTDSLQRPIDLGEVTFVNTRTVHFGKTTIPPTPELADFFTFDRIEISTDPWEYWRSGKLEIRSKFVRPHVFLPQDSKGELSNLPQEPLDLPPWLDLKTVTISDGRLTLGIEKTKQLVTIDRLQIESDWQGMESLVAQGKGEVKLAAWDRALKPEQKLEWGNSKGKVNLNLSWNLRQNQGELRIQNRDVDLAVAQNFLTDLPFTLISGRVNGDVGLRFLPNQVAQVQGAVKLTQGEVIFPGATHPLQAIEGQFIYDGMTTTLNQVKAKYNDIPLTAQGTITPDRGMDIDLAIPSIDLGQSLAGLAVESPVVLGGKIAVQGKLQGIKPSFRAVVTNQTEINIDRVLLDRSELVLDTKDFQTWQLLNLSAQSDLGTIDGAGTLILGDSPSLDLNLNARDLAGETIAQRYEFNLPFGVGAVTANARLQGRIDDLSLVLNASAPQADYPLEAQATIAQGVTTIDRVELLLPEGRVTGNGIITEKGWSGNFSTQELNLPQASLAGKIEVISPKGSFDPKELQAKAELELPKGFGRAKDTIRSSLSWDGKKVLVENLSLGSILEAKGEVDLEFNEQEMPQGLGEVNLQVKAENTDVASLSQFVTEIPKTIEGNLDFDGQVRGKIDQLQLYGNLQGNNIRLKGDSDIPTGTIGFESTISGSILDPRLQGQMTLRDLAYRDIAFEPSLQGNFSLQPSQGLDLDLKGNTDRIAVKLDQRFQPQNIDIRLQDSIARARPVGGEKLEVTIENFPIALIAAPLGEKDLSGDMSGTGTMNLGDKFRTVGEFTIDRPRYGRIQGEKLTANFAYNNGNVFLREGKLIIPLADGERTSSYEFDLAYTPQAQTRLMGNLRIADGSIQDITQIMQWSKWEDLAQGLDRPKFAKSIALQPFPQVGLPKGGLREQLNYFSQIQQRLIQQEIANAETNSLPPLTDLRGTLTGKVSIQDRSQTGLGVQVELEGRNWEYGKFAVDDINFEGEYRNGTVTIGNARLQSADSFGELREGKIALVDPQTGKLGEIQGELELAEFPIQSLRPLPFFRIIPVEVTGKVKGKATLSGNILQPQAKGQLELAEGTISQEPIESIKGDFDYNQGRFKFKSILALAEAPPMQLSGDIPLQIGYVFPGSKIQMDLEVRDKALGFINLVNPNVRWIDGRGEAKIAVSGTTKQPKLLGNASIAEAEIQVAGLPSDITNLNGSLQFDLDRVTADLEGKFSQGELRAKGSIPITNENLENPNPLTVTANRLALDLKNTYTGNFDGNLNISGSLQNPIVSGMVALSNGRIPLPDEPVEKNGNGKAPSTIAFRDLKVDIGENIQISRAPLLNFVGKGEITVNGTINDIRPSGRVAVTRGQVNAISARFRLDRSFDSFAEFLPNQGLDPNLNVRVLGAVPEVTRTPIEPSPFDAFNPGSIPVSNLGAQRTLQVQATVTGRASNPTIELRSSPPRTNSEILALIGGGLLTQTGGDATTALVNLAGGTFISFFQDAIGDVLNLSEFNLSPVTNSSDGRRISALGLAAEGAIDIGRDFSVSIRSVINDPSQTTSYTLRYRLNPNTLLRTNTDLKGNNSTTIEFENRF